MEDEKVDPNYTKGFNLGYWLNKNEDGEKYYQELLDIQKSPKFKETTLYQGLVAGRDEALQERTKANDGKMPLLNEEQKKEAQDFLDTYDAREQGIKDKISKQRRLNTRIAEARSNSDFVEDETEKKKQEFMKKFMERGKGSKDHEK